MCGIVGHIGKNKTDTHLDYLKHRGLDASRTWTNGSTCTLGHVRLSILDLDKRSNQPMCDEQERFFIVFNGEIYNYIELREKYLSDVPLKTTSDTEVLLRLWIKYKEKALPKLRGMFAFAIWDNKKEKLWLARDRFGQKPLHYYQKTGGISFGSELNILRKDIQDSLSINHTAVGMFLKYQFIPAPHTIYEGLKKLLPAHFLVWEKGDVRIERYWDISFNESFDPDISEKEAIEKIEHKIKDSIKIRLRSDVPVGSLLSGGVDSSLVTGIASQMTTGKFHTFSIGFSNQEYNELEYAKKVAERYDTNHHEYILEENQALNYLDKSIEQYGEPFGDKSSLPSLLVSKIASEKLKVVLNGDGGDELLGGYPKYRINVLHDFLRSLNRQKYAIGKKINGLKGHFDLDLLNYVIFRLNYSALNPYYRVIDFREFFDERYFSSACASNFQKGKFLKDEKEYLKSIFSRLNPKNHTINQLLKIDYQHYFSNDLLVKMDIASMAYCLETRSPLMDHELMEESARLPEKYKIQNGTGKYLLKKIAENYLPHELIYRKKMGFSIPVNKWMKGQFGDELLELIADRQNLAWQYINRDYFKSLLDEHRNNEKDHSGRLWVGLILSKWFEWSDDFK